MKLHELDTIKSRRSKRIARGGKRGTTSGRGTKGQRSRSGHRIRPALRDLIIRIPKKRGFRNKPKSDKAIVVDLGVLTKKLLSRNMLDKTIVDRTTLKALKLIPDGYSGNVKILGKAELKQPLRLKGLLTSKPVSEFIAKSGGSVEL